MLSGETVYINGDGATSRDFCFVANAVQANLLAALCDAPESLNQIYNIAVSGRTTLSELFQKIRLRLESGQPGLKIADAVHRAQRAGDVRHSQADIGKAQRLLGYRPTHTIDLGLDAAMGWYMKDAMQQTRVDVTPQA
jgi:UDP-N-acetylglucosamine 4-epimerase